MSRLFESDERPPWLPSYSVTDYSLVIVKETCQIEGNLGSSDNFAVPAPSLLVGGYVSTKYGKLN